jgi:TonB family protein
MPALVNKSVGSCAGINEELGTAVWPWRSKKEKNFSRISRDFIIEHQFQKAFLIEHKAVINFSISRSGEVSEVSVGETSNDQRIDGLALAAIKGLGKQSALPDCGPYQFLSFQFVFTEPLSYGSNNLSILGLDYTPYMTGVQNHLRKVWYSTQSRRWTRSLHCTALFKIDRSGAISGARISRSSGVPDYDQDALGSLKNVRLGKPPTGSPASVDIEFTFDYNVGR